MYTNSALLPISQAGLNFTQNSYSRAVWSRATGANIKLLSSVHGGFPRVTLVLKSYAFRSQLYSVIAGSQMSLSSL
jgi:hypothetical protein